MNVLDLFSEWQDLSKVRRQKGLLRPDLPEVRTTTPWASRPERTSTSGVEGRHRVG
jgi:hypothetical protein